MELREITSQLPSFGSLSHTDKIKFFAWYLHKHGGKERVTQAYVRDCYDTLHLEKPSNVSAYFDSLTKKRPKELLKDRQGYFLPAHVREVFDNKYGHREATAQVHKLLTALPDKIPGVNAREYLTEALICFRHKAYRASIVMTWNLAFDHLCDQILAQHLTDFNTQLPKSYPNEKLKAVTCKDSFAELKESQVLRVCRSAKITSSNVDKILNDKLAKRNSAAHPSNITITQIQAEDFIIDLVSNVLLKQK